MHRTTITRLTAATAGVLLLSGVATAAIAAEQDSDGVDISVDIAEIDEPGVLALTVGATQASLAENGSTPTVRQFTGSLPTVTVTDTRDADEIPAGAGWSVSGTASDFVGTAGQPAISAAHLGWQPRLVDTGDSGLVSEGDRVDTVLDSGPNNVGLVEGELLAITNDSAGVSTEGSWTATADLFLRTPADIAPGSYSSTLTLSLFE